MMFVLLLMAEVAALSLTCSGHVTVQAVDGTSSVQAVDNRGNAATANGVTTSPTVVSLTTGFEMKDGQARVYLPAEMRPAFSKTKDGWFPVDNLVVTADRITGAVRLNFMRTTVIEIDRATGVLTTKHGYRADCVAIDRTQRKF